MDASWGIDVHGSILPSQGREPGSIPGSSIRRYSIGAVPRLVAPVALVRFQVVAFLFFLRDFLVETALVSSQCRYFAFIAQLAEHALSKRKVTSSILVEGSLILVEC